MIKYTAIISPPRGAALYATIGAVLLSFGTAASAQPSSAQTVSGQPECLAPQGRLPELAESAVRPIDLIPRGWKLYDKADGDLNGDGLADSALVIQVNDPQGEIYNTDGLGYDYIDRNQRALLVIFQDGAGQYSVAASDDAIIPDWSSPTINDPYDALAIKDGTLALNLQYWANAGSWETRQQEFLFRWNGEAFPLIGYEATKVHRGSGDMEHTSVNYVSGKRKDAKGSISDEKENWVWGKVDKAAAPLLGAVGNGFEFTP